jgi:hypothetical protein
MGVSMLMYRPRKSVRALIDADGCLLMDLENGQYYSLNRVGAEVWRGVEVGSAVEDIAATLSSSYSVSQDELVADVEFFVTALEEKGLIESYDPRA